MIEMLKKLRAGQYVVAFVRSHAYAHQVAREVAAPFVREEIRLPNGARVRCVSNPREAVGLSGDVWVDPTVWIGVGPVPHQVVRGHEML